MWGYVIASVVAQVAQGSKAKTAAKKTAKQNAAGVFAETTEKIRRTLLTQSQELGLARAKYGASGLSLESASIENYLAEIKSNFAKNINWLKKAREMGVKTELQKGENAASTIRANTTSSVINTAQAGYNQSQRT